MEQSRLNARTFSHNKEAMSGLRLEDTIDRQLDSDLEAATLQSQYSTLADMVLDTEVSLFLTLWKRVVFCRGRCGILKSVVWYFVERGVVL